MKQQSFTRLLLKDQCQKTIHILSEIAKDKNSDTLKKRDKRDLAKYQAILEEYNAKSLRNQQNVKPNVFNCNRYLHGLEKNKRSTVCKALKAK